MLDIGEAIYKGKPASVFAIAANRDPSQSLPDIMNRLRERFRCGDAPSATHTPLIGEIAFVKTAADAQPALAALTHELDRLFNVICVQADPGRYIVAVVRDAATGFAPGDAIPIAEVKEHDNPWSTR